MKKHLFDYAVVAAGIVLLGIGFLLIKTLSAPQGIMAALPYILIGVGCGVFGHGMGNVISRRALKYSPDIRRQMEIDQKDERNVAISCRSKAKAYDMMVFVFSALILSFALMKVDIIVILLLVFSYLLVVFYGVYNRCKLDKEM